MEVTMSHQLADKTHQSANSQIVRDSSLYAIGTFVSFILCNLCLTHSVYAITSTIGITISGNPTVNIQSTSDGVFSDSGNSAITVTTNHASGYTLTARASSATFLVGTKGGSLATLNAGTAIDATTFNTSTYNDKWGYKPSKYNSIDNTVTGYYYPSPGLGTTESPADVLDITSNSNSSPYTYTVSIGARVTTDTPIDSYSNQFVFAVVGNATPYAITYNKNTTDTVSNMPTNHTTSDTGATGETVAIAANAPTRTGYTFNGWCTTTPVTSGGIDSCSGTTYAAGGSWTINQTSATNSLTLYAMWNRRSYNVKVNFAGSDVSSVTFAATGYTTRTVSSSGGTASLMYGVRYTTTMNFSKGYEFSSWALNNNSYGTLSSTSANPTYFTPNVSSASAIITATGKTNYCTKNGVANANCMQKMTSSNCTTTAKTVTDSRDGSTYKVQKLADGKCWMLDNLRLDPTTVNLATLRGSTNATNATLGYLKNGGGSSPYTGTAVANKTSGFTQYNVPNVNVSYKNNTTTSYGSGSGKVGVYYNFCAASAGSYCYAKDVGTGNASQDLCPTGWRMPTGGASGEYKALYTAYSSNITNFRNALSTPLSGYFYNSSQNSLGSWGDFWASTYYDGNYMGYLYVGSSDTDPASHRYRVDGLTMRCVLK